MANIRQLYVALNLKAESYLNDIREAQKEAKELEKVIKPAREAVTSLGTTMTVVGGAVSAAFIAATVKTAEYGDMLANASERSGIATEKLAGLALAAAEADTDFGELSKGLNKMSLNAVAAANGGKAQAEAFKSIGVNVKDASGAMKPMDQILGEVSEHFKGMKDPVEKAALAQELFGKGGVALIPLLNGGKEGLDAAAESAKRFGLAMSGEAAAKSKEFQDRLTDVEKATQGIAISIGSQFLPVITDLAVKLTDVIVGVRQWVDAHPDLTKAIGALAVGLTGAGGLLLGLGGVLTILPAITAAFALVGAPILIAAAAIGALVAAMAAFPQVRAVVIGVFESIIESIGAFAGVLGNVAKSVWELVHGEFKQAWDTVKNTGAASMEAAGKATAGFESVLKSLSPTMAAATTETKKTTNEQKAMTVAVKATTDEVKKQKEAWNDLQKDLKTLPINGVSNDFVALQMKLDGTKDKAQTLFNILKTEPPQVVVSLSAATQAQNALNSSIATAITNTPLLTASQNAAITAITTLNQKNSDASDLHKQLTEDVKAQAAAQVQAQADLAKAIGEVKESAGQVFDDMFLKGQNVFTSLKNLLEGGALSLGRAMFQDISGALLGPIKQGFDDFFTGLIESTGIKNFVTSIGNKLGGLIPGLGGGASVSSAVGAGGSVSGSVGGAGSAAGGAGGAATGILGGVIGGGISAVGSFLSTMRLEGTMNAVEFNTRSTYILIRDMMDFQWNWILNFAQIGVDRLQELINILDTTYNLFNDKLFTAGAPSASIAGVSAAGAAPAAINIQNEFSPNYVFYGVPESLKNAIRDEIEPTLMRDLELNTRGIMERLVVALRNNGAGVVAAPAG